MADLGLIALYRFGSRNRGTAGSDSDLDLAFLAPRGWTAWQREEVAGIVAERAACEYGLAFEQVDVQDLGLAPAWFRAEVVLTGTLLFAGDSFELARFQGYSLSEAFDEEIRMRPIHEAFWQRVREGRFAS